MPVPDPEPFRLLKQYPLLCGLFTFVLKTRAQEIGLAFANAWGSILYASHLYNAARQEKLLLKSWTDLELLIALHSPERFFVGDCPKSLEEYLKRFLLSMGYSATAFASNRRSSALAASARGPRRLTKLCKAGALFAGRYCNNDRNVSVSIFSELFIPNLDRIMGWRLVIGVNTLQICFIPNKSILKGAELTWRFCSGRASPSSRLYSPRWTTTVTTTTVIQLNPKSLPLTKSPRKSRCRQQEPSSGSRRETKIQQPLQTS